jgi:hypothetical protein
MEQCTAKLAGLAIPSHPRKTHATQQIERTFFTLRVIARNMNPQDDKFGPQIMYFINSLPTDTSLQLRYTVVELIGQMAQWLKHNTSFLEQVLTRLVTEIQAPELATIAAEAVLELCLNCRASMTPHFSYLVQVQMRMSVSCSSYSVQLAHYAEESKFSTENIERLYEVGHPHVHHPLLITTRASPRSRPTSPSRTCMHP